MKRVCSAGFILMHCVRILRWPGSAVQTGEAKGQPDAKLRVQRGETGRPGGLSSGPVYFINRGWQISTEALLPWPFGEDVLCFRLLTNYCA